MKKAISIFLSLLLLVSSSGIAYAQHFCGGHEMLAQVTLGEKHLSCGMVMTKPGCEEESIMTMESHCCSNVYTKVETDENYTQALFDLILDMHFAVAVVLVAVIPQYEMYPKQVHAFRDYDPPPLDNGILVRYQVFLI